jgi:hypothetical protein
VKEIVAGSNGNTLTATSETFMHNQTVPLIVQQQR